MAPSVGSSPANVTELAGLVIPSTSPLFLGLVVVHALIALVAVIAGAAAMLSRKGPGRHRKFGTVYFWSLGSAVAIALILSLMRWRENYPLAILGTLTLVAATIGRLARRGQWRAWIPFHIGGMGGSYILMLTAFYVDNGKNLPLWRELPSIAYWLLPTLIGSPIAIRATLRHRPRHS